MRYFTPIALVLLAGCLRAQPAAETKEFDLAGNQSWLDTGLDVRAGDGLRILARGTLQFPSSKANGPEGLPRGWRDLVRNLPMNDGGRGTLLARIGDRDTSMMFATGASKETRAASTGRLFLGINHQSNDPAQGSYHVTIAITRAAAPAVSTVAAPAAPLQLTQEMLDQIPARIGDAAGNPGDRVNFLIVGSEQGVEKVFQTAGWVKVDRSVTAGGSPVVDALPAQFQSWTSLLKLGKCEGDLNAALRSLRRDVRQAFLASHPDSPVPAYSIVATSDRGNTSKALLEAWRLLSVYDPKQDSQLTEADATLPGSKFLGAAKADHLAITLPFEKSKEISILNVIDHGHFPRAALLEALVRLVVQDLDGK